jgi:hypothetical protein
VPILSLRNVAEIAQSKSLIVVNPFLLKSLTNGREEAGLVG